MQCVILCGGLGTRMREETEFRPKPMVKIGERPILWHIMKHYASHGIREFVLGLGYKGEMIRDFFLRYEYLNSDVTIELGKPDEVVVHGKHDEIGWKITLADTGEQTLKGARLKLVERYVEGDTFMMTYGDGVSDIDLGKLLAFHRSHGKIGTVTGVSPTARFGELDIAGDRVQAFAEKPKTQEGHVNGGFFVFDRRFFKYLSPNPDCDLEYGALEKLAHDSELMVYRHDGFWACMDTLRDVDFLNDLWRRQEAPWKTW